MIFLRNTKSQYHIDENGDLFLSNLPHPYTQLSKKDLQVFLNKLLKDSPYKFRKTKNLCHYYITRNGKAFVETILTVSDSGGYPTKRKVRVPFSNYNFIAALKRNTLRDFLIISPYSTVKIAEDGSIYPDKTALLVMNKKNLFASNFGKHVFESSLDNINEKDFTYSSRWFGIESIKDSIFNEQIIENSAKNLNCIPISLFITYLDNIWASYCRREAKTTSKSKNNITGFSKALKKGLRNERLYYSKLLEDSDFLHKTSIQCSNDGENIVSVSHTGGNKILSIYGKKITQKADLVFKTDLNKIYNVSLKMTLSAYLHSPTVSKWLESMERIFLINIPQNVKEMIYLFFKSPNTPYFNEIIKRYATEPDEIRHNRLFAKHLREYSNEKTNEMIQWFKEHQLDIFKFSAITGNIADSSQHITHIAFINAETLNSSDSSYLNKIIPVDKLLEDLSHCDFSASFNPVGTQIKFPWGTIENHSNKMYTKINEKWIEQFTSCTYHNDAYNGFLSA